MCYCSAVVCSILVSQHMSLIEVSYGRCEVFYSEWRLSLSRVGISLAGFILPIFENLPTNVQPSFQRGDKRDEMNQLRCSHLINAVASFSPLSKIKYEYLIQVQTVAWKIVAYFITGFVNKKDWSFVPIRYNNLQLFFSKQKRKRRPMTINPKNRNKEMSTDTVPFFFFPCLSKRKIVAGLWCCSCVKSGLFTFGLVQLYQE